MEVPLSGTDLDGYSLTFQVVALPRYGELSGEWPRLLYTPRANYHGQDEVGFVARDRFATSQPATITFQVRPVNDPPVARDVSITVPWNTAIPMGLSGWDVDGDSLRYSIETGPTHGTLHGTAPHLQYVHSAGFIGRDEILYRVDDGTAVSNVARVTVHVTRPTEPVTVSFQDGVFPTVSYAGTRDTKIRGDQSSTTHGTSHRLELDGHPDIASLLQWDVTHIPRGSQVHSAALTFHVVNTSIHHYGLYALLRPWAEATASFRNAATAKPWQIAGALGSADRDPRALGTATASQLGTLTIPLNEAGLAVVQGWVNDSQRNFGLILQNYLDASTDDLDFHSRDASNVLQRPKLTVSYIPDSAPSPLRFAPLTLAWTNPRNPYDVNDDQHVTSQDALVLINRLNAIEGEDASFHLESFPDVSGDGLVSPHDVLLIINLLHRMSDEEPIEADDAEDPDSSPLERVANGILASLHGEGEAFSANRDWSGESRLSRGDRVAVQVLLPPETAANVPMTLERLGRDGRVGSIPDSLVCTSERGDEERAGTTRNGRNSTPIEPAWERLEECPDWLTDELLESLCDSDRRMGSPNEQGGSVCRVFSGLERVWTAG
jgi:hypothetical protein